MMPSPLAVMHDQFVEDFFESAKSKIMNRNVNVFGLTKDGYLKLVNLLIKVYPLVNNKVVLIGFLQNTDQYDLMIPPLP